MAVESNKGGNGNGVANGAPRRRKRASSLLAVASSLPSVESSLDEFIARANQTMVDAEQWRSAEIEAKQEDDKRREADALRWKAAEQQLREGEAREQALRRQLDGLQGQLAEAEARAAVASGGSNDAAVIADLKYRLSRSDDRAASAEARMSQLAEELEAAKARPSLPIAAPLDRADADERARIAEAKAVKALAAARAAAAGLTVSAADLAAIESGLVVPIAVAPPRATSWIGVVGAFAIGLGLMFGITKLVASNASDNAAPAPPAPQQPAVAAQPQPAPAPAAAPAPAPAPKPTVTPIEDPTPPAPAAAVAPPEAPPPVEATRPAAPAHHAVVHHAAAPHAAPAAASSGLADPFGGSAPAAKKPAAKPASGKSDGLADPF